MKYSLFLIFLIFWSCTGDTSQIDSLFQYEDISQEVISDVKITYSDSAQVLLMVKSPLLTRKEVDAKTLEEFPDGLSVEFYEGNHHPSAWLRADRGIRYPDEKKIMLSGNVELFNAKNEKLETAELYWYEDKNEISTEKFVRITQPEKGDTTYGFGFVSDQNFKRFEIKRKFFGKIEEDMIRELN